MRLTLFFFLLCRYERPAGLLITLYVYVVYTVALKFEGCAASFRHRRARFADAAQAVHQHDLLQAVDICEQNGQERALKPARDVTLLHTTLNDHYNLHAHSSHLNEIFLGFLIFTQQ